jgi:putative inorganic carbon (HCO3(-)) transporter
VPDPLTLRVDQAAVAAALALSGVIFLTNTSDPVNVPKLVVVLLCALAAAAAAAARAVRARALRLPWGLPAAAGIALVIGFCLSAAVAPQGVNGILGAYGRNSGLLAYLAALVLYAGTLRAFDAGATKIIALALVLAGLFTGSYGLLQRLGWDAIHWNNPFNPIIASLGNPDFASAYLGITAPVTLWAACWTDWSRLWRVLAAATVLLCLLVAALSSAVQGPLAAAAGLSVVALAAALDLTGSRRRAALGALGGAAGTGLLVVLAGAAGAGPARSFFTGISYDARTWYWRAAITMWHRSPLTGIGLDSYGLYWRRDRPLANPRTVGGDAYSDSAHSVPLQHLAQGGIVLLAAYLFFVAVVATGLVRGLRRLRGQDRLLLSGLGGAWVAYQVQSLVSIDQVPLLVLNFVLGGGVLVASGSTKLREVRLPGALKPVQPARGRKVLVQKPRPTSPLDVALLSGLAVALLVAMWLSTRPLRANHAVYVGDVALSTGQGNAALDSFSRAVDLEPGRGLYRTRLGQTYQAAQRPAEAQRAFEDAFARDASEINAGRTAARLAEATGDTRAAARLYARTLKLDPTNSATILDWARFELAQGRPADVRRRLERAVRDLPADAGLWSALGDARAALADGAGAKAAYERALQLKPDEAGAKAGLDKLSR